MKDVCHANQLVGNTHSTVRDYSESNLRFEMRMFENPFVDTNSR